MVGIEAKNTKLYPVEYILNNRYLVEKKIRFVEKLFYDVFWSE